MIGLSVADKNCLFAFPRLLETIPVPIMLFTLLSVSLTTELETEPESWGRVLAVRSFECRCDY